MSYVGFLKRSNRLNLVMPTSVLTALEYLFIKAVLIYFITINIRRKIYSTLLVYLKSAITNVLLIT